ncbi:MAG: TonB-dependent copper receptor [Endomicrobium sp.]|jgi:iron complex outermembrane receptor protein|nr:TonB-dependent copper receptor [Endomicrobium sp.]
MEKMKFAIFIAVFLILQSVLFAFAQEITLNKVIVIAAPLGSPLEIVLDPKQAKQPVPASDATDYLKTVPGFSAIRSGGANSDTVFRGAFGSRINIVSGGGNIFGGCPSRMDSPASYISPESYDSVTIIKGPQSVLYGAASAATVIFEKEALNYSENEKKYDVKADIIAGSYERAGVNIDAAFGNEYFYFRTFFNKDFSQDYKDGDGKTVPSKYDKWSADVQLGLTPSENYLIEIGAGTGDGYARYAGRGMDGSQFKRETLNLKFERKNIAEILDKIEFNSYYNRADHIMDNYSLRQPSGMMNMRMLSNPARTVYGARTILNFNFGENNKLKSGIDAQYDRHESRGNLRNPFTKDLEFDKYGVFSELSSSLSEKSKITAGIRGDFASAKDLRRQSASQEKTRGEFLPNAFARFEQSFKDGAFLWYAGIGHNQRFPDYWELIQTSVAVNSRNINAFENLKAEKTSQIDAGLQVKAGTADFWLSAYGGYIKDYILFNYATVMMSNVKLVENADAQIYGAETGLSYLFIKVLRAEASLAYSYGQNVADNKPLPQIPPLETRVSLSYENKKLTAGLLWRAAARQNRIAQNQGNVAGKDFADSKAFNVFSANASFSANDNLKISAGIDNIFDETYSEHLNLAGSAGWGFAANERIHEPGRNIWIKINVTF